MKKIFIIVFSLFMLTSCSTSPDPEDCIGGDVVAVTTSPEGNHIHICKDGSEYVSIEEGYEYHMPTPSPARTPQPEPSYDPVELAELEAMTRKDAVANAREQGLYTYEDLAVAYYDLEQMYNELEYENDELRDENEELYDDISNYEYD